MLEIKDIPKMSPEDAVTVTKSQGFEDVINEKAVRIAKIFGENAVEKMAEGEVFFRALYMAISDKKKEQIPITLAACRDFLTKEGESLVVEMKEDMNAIEQITTEDLQGEIYNTALKIAWDTRSAFAGGQPDHIERYKREGRM